MFICVCVCVLPVETRGGGPPGAGITGDCELPDEYWDLNSGPLEEQHVLLTTEPSISPAPEEFSQALR